MDGEPQLLYLEPDDEVTSVVRRLRGADAGRIVLVAPGRSRATSSVVALRLLARAASETGRSVALVADASTRALAGEAGIASFASVADATSPTPSPAEPLTPTRAPIRVVRGAAVQRNQPAKPLPATNGMEETVAVHLPPAISAGRASGRPRSPLRLPRWPWLAAVLVLALVAGAALLPGATVSITPATIAVTPQNFPVQTSVISHLIQDFEATQSVTATGERVEQVPASGVVTFSNWNTVAVDVPQGTHVSVGGATVFVTLEKITVPRGRFGAPIEPGQRSVGVAAVVPGTAGNVAAGAIDTIDDATVRGYLRGFPDNPNRLVTNPEATSGGLETPHPVIQQSDVDAALAAIEADLRQQLSDALSGEPDRIYADPPETETTSVLVPEDLVGKEDTPTFELTGTLHVERAYASRADVEAAASGALQAPLGTNIVADSVVVDVRSAAEQGDSLLVQVSVTAEAAAIIDDAALRERIAGKTVEEANAELESFGVIDVDLWPPWVDRLPQLSFRIRIETVTRSVSESPSP